MSRVIASCLLVLVGVTAVTACAPKPTTLDERAHAIEGQVWSPYCPGRLLLDCTTSQARDLRSEITRRLRGGDSSGRVLRWIRSDFGDDAIAKPSAHGAGLAIWLVPALLFALGALVVVALVARWTRRRPTTEPVSQSTSEIPQRIRDEVERDI